MINNILKKYVKLTSDELLDKYIDSLSSTESDIDPTDEEVMFTTLKGVDGFMDWIDKQVANDMKKHFGAINEKQRDNIRGMMMRLLDIKKRLVKPEKQIVTKISGIRYGS